MPAISDRMPPVAVEYDTRGGRAAKRDGGWVWVLSGQRDGLWIVAEGKMQEEAWRRFADASAADFRVSPQMLT
jgi:hypothetical protein